MKKLLLLLFLSLFIFSACKDDDDTVEIDNPSIEYTDDGLQSNVSGIVNDTIIRNSTMNIEIIDGNLNNINPNQVYELKLSGNNFLTAKKGTTLIDNVDGRLWVVKDILSQNNNITTVKAFVGGLGNLFQNAIFKYSSGTNHSKENSTNPNKLTPYEAKLITSNSENSWQVNSESIYTSFPLPSIIGGISASRDQFGNIILEFDNFSFSENLPNNLPLTINDGTIIINNAIDLETKFNPANALLALTNPLSFNKGVIKNFKSSIYTTTELDLQFSADINATFLETSEKIVDIFVGVPISPYAFVVLRLEGIIETSIDAGVTFNIAPRYVTKDDFTTLIDYNGTLPTLSFEHNNIENSTNTVGNYSNFDAKIKFDFITKSTVLMYGLLGPSGEISSYFDINGRLFHDTNTNTNSWDISIDVGMSSELSLSTIFWASSDVVLNQGLETTDLFTLENDDFFNINLFKTPATSQIIEGNYQTGIANNQLNNEIKIKVLSSEGLHRNLVPVYFETTDGNGNFNTTTIITDNNGIASNIWTLGANIGEQTAHIYAKDGNGDIIPETEQTITAYVNSNNSIPTVTTTAITDITQTTATSGGNVTDEGGSTVTEKGIVWSTNPNPAITDNPTADGTGLDSFISSLTGLTENTTYYVKAYATNSFGTGFGDEIQFTTLSNITTVTDYDGNIYETIEIGTQIWMKENLKTTKFADGTSIPLIESNTDWSNLLITDYAYSFQNNNQNNEADVYGALYTWNTIMQGQTSSTNNPSGIQGICPDGWHIPSNSEWFELINFLGGSTNSASGKMKEGGLEHWNAPNTGADNSSGFTALPAGDRFHETGIFQTLGHVAGWWTSTEFDSNSGRTIILHSDNNTVFNYDITKTNGLSCRCIKD